MLYFVRLTGVIGPAFGVKLSDNPWDDEAFKRRVRAAVKKKGITLRAALDAADVSRYHLDKSGEGRSTSTILKLAQVLDVSPAYLFGLTPDPELPGLSSETKKHREGDWINLRGKPIDNLVCVSLFTKVIAAQLATLVYMASNHAGGDAALQEFVLRLIDQIANNVDRGGKGPA